MTNEITPGSSIVGRIREITNQMNRMRGNILDLGLKSPDPTGMTSEQYEQKCADYQDVTLRSMLESEYETTPEKLFYDLGINPHTTTLERLLTMDDDSRWLVPEIFRDAIRKGMRLDPWHTDIVAVSEPIAQPTLVMPYIESSTTATPKTVAEAETIGEGTITYGTKTVKVSKVGVGIKMTYESLRFCAINLLSIFMQEIGTKLGHKLNGDAVAVLINGDQADGSEAAARVGVTTALTLTYADIVRIWIRMGRLVRPITSSIAGEQVANDIMNLAEFKVPVQALGATYKALTVKTPIPTGMNLYCHSDVPAGRIIFLDTTKALVQLTAAPLLVESEKIVSKQINGSYATIITGFANIFRNARVIMDYGTAGYTYAAHPFPAWMDV